MLKLTTASILAAAFALPVMAQTPTPNHSNAALNAPATHDTAGNPTGGGYNTPSQRNPVATDNGGLRASKIVGSSVYNDHDQKIGSIDDLVIGRDKTLNAVVSVGGFLGMGSKMVEVPFNKLEFGNTKGSNDNRVVLPGMTKDALNAMPEYITQIKDNGAKQKLAVMAAGGPPSRPRRPYRRPKKLSTATTTTTNPTM
jgi:hypothetical protein